MSALTGGTKTISGVPPDIAGLRKNFADFLGGQNYQNLLFPTYSGNDASLQPYRNLFQKQNAQGFAQAKESAGNLTGSGYGNILGRYAQQATTQQNAFLAQLLEAHNQANANRGLQAILGLGTSGVAPPQTVYQPGLFGSLAGAAGAAAPFLAGYGGGGGGNGYVYSSPSGYQLGQLHQYPITYGGTTP